MFTFNIASLNEKQSRHLDFLRGIAAILVLINHLRSLFFVEYFDVISPNFLVKFLYLITGLGHQAVIIFFVLSGYFISTSVIKSVINNRWSWLWYLNQRLIRLWIVLIPALLLTAWWDQLGMYCFQTGGVYTGLESDQYILTDVTKHTSIYSLLGNVFFLQGIRIGTFGSNGALWSLSNEFWYYVLFPAIFLILRVRLYWYKLFYLCFATGTAIFLGYQVMLYFLIWLLGTFVLLACPKREISMQFSRFLTLFTGFCFVLTLLGLRLRPQSWGDFAVAIVFALLLYAIVLPTGHSQTTTNNHQKQSSKSFASWLAGFSYTLYVAHLPPLVFLHAWVHSYSGQKWQPDLIHFTIALAIIAFTLLYAWSLSLLTEAKTEYARSVVMKKLHTMTPHKRTRS